MAPVFWQCVLAHLLDQERTARRDLRFQIFRQLRPVVSLLPREDKRKIQSAHERRNPGVAGLYYYRKLWYGF